uniref:Uncharacterized protein n=1 Tax=Amphimedon queenslandica TaxID=400682 RepID=A0A1X7VVW8_AMPQE
MSRVVGDGFFWSSLSNSTSCPMKLRFGDIAGRLS